MEGERQYEMNEKHDKRGRRRGRSKKGVVKGGGRMTIAKKYGETNNKRRWRIRRSKEDEGEDMGKEGDKELEGEWQ